MPYLIILLTLTSTLAFGAEGPTMPTPETYWWMKIFGILIGVQLVLRGLADGLTKIAVLTENKWDNKIAGWIGQACWLLGAFLGKFGYSVPKAVIAQKAKEMNEQATEKTN